MNNPSDGLNGAVSPPRADVSEGSVNAFEAELRAVARALPDQIGINPEDAESGLARLVLTLVELLRNVLEHQAIRRMDGGSLSDEQIERLGLSLMRLNERMAELKTAFHVTDDDLNIDLGPLGRLR